MGRPIKSTLMSATTDRGGHGTSGRLAVTAYYPSVVHYSKMMIHLSFRKEDLKDLRSNK